MSKNIRDVLSAAVLKLLRPLVRILLRNGFSYGEFADLAKWVFVDVADREFGIQGRKQTVSRVSIITGLNRKEVSRLKKMETPSNGFMEQQYNRAARVIAAWRREENYRNPETGRPAELPLDGGQGSFSELVKRFSGDMPVRAVLDELERVGAVSVTKAGGVRLLTEAYVPGRAETGKLHILGTDVSLLLETIDHNLHMPDAPRFQRKVLYDNLPEEVIPRFREMSARKSQELLEAFDRYLAQHDRDANPRAEGAGRATAGVGIYYFEKHESGANET